MRVEAQFPWSTPKRKHRMVMVRVRLQGRGRWRWWCVMLSWPLDTMSKEGHVQSVTLEAKSWLTDESMRGNLRHKAFVRWHFKAGMGGIPQTGRYCPVLNGKGQRCTWERGHLPMIVDYAGSPRAGVYAHSWQAKLGPKATVVQEPRRRALA